MHNLTNAAGRRKVGLAVAVLLAGGLAGTVLLVPGTALAATPQVATTTNITGTQQGGQGWNTATLQVNVSVTATSGSQAPSGDVTVSAAPGHCTAALTAGSGLVSSGSCDLHAMSYGSYTLTASYGGTSTFASSVSSNDPVTVGIVPAWHADSPSLSTSAGGSYGYNFNAKGDPAPSYALASGAPSWLSISSSTGALSGTVPAGISSFSYSVTAANGVGTATAGPFNVRVSPQGNNGTNIYTHLNCPGAVVSGQRGSCTLYVTNAGWSRTSNVSAEVILPRQLRAEYCGRGEGWGGLLSNCYLSNNTAFGQVGSLAPGQTKSLSVVFAARTSGVFYAPRWQRPRPVRVTVVGVASADNGYWSHHTSVSFAHVVIFPRNRFPW
jgi:hypothetical protein